jgi:uncharacterized membrane protein
MLIQNQTLRWMLAAIVVLLLIPLIGSLGMMIAGTGMMTQMGMSSSMMALCGLWSILVAAVLTFLLVVLIRGAGGSDRASIDRPATRSPLMH